MANHKRLYKSVADMPPIMRIICECLVADRYRNQRWPTKDIAAKLGIKVRTVQAHICSAMKAIGVESRGALTEWCWRGRYCRPVSSGLALHSISVMGIDGVMCEVLRDSAIEALKKNYPDEFLDAARRFEDKWDRIGVAPPEPDAEPLTSLPWKPGESYARQFRRYSEAGLASVWPAPDGWLRPDGSIDPKLMSAIVPEY